MCVEVRMMAKHNKTQAGTNIQEVRQRNAQSAQGQTTHATTNATQQFGTEFGSETDVQTVKQQNQQAEARKAGSTFGQQTK